MCSGTTGIGYLNITQLSWDPNHSVVTKSQKTILVQVTLRNEAELMTLLFSFLFFTLSLSCLQVIVSYTTGAWSLPGSRLAVRAFLSQE